MNLKQFSLTFGLEKLTKKGFTAMVMDAINDKFDRKVELIKLQPYKAIFVLEEPDRDSFWSRLHLWHSDLEIENFPFPPAAIEDWKGYPVPHINGYWNALRKC